MAERRFEPYAGRRAPRAAYRAWQRMDIPVIPRGTQERYAQRNANAIPINEDRAVVQDEEHVQNGVDQHEVEMESRAGSSISDHLSRSTSSSSMQNEVSSAEQSDATNADERPSSETGGDSDSDNDSDEDGPTRIPDLDNPLFPGGDCTKFECLLMILSFSLRHGLTQVATQDLCIMMNHMLRGDHLPSSKYMLRKIFGRSAFLVNFYCKQCESFIIAKKNSEQMVGVHVCTVCGVECRLSNMNEGHFFVTFPLKHQLKFFLENTEDILDMVQYRWTRNHNQEKISDIYDGKVYSELARDGNFLSERFNLSLTFNTDGAQVFESTNNTLWPIFFRLNELPPRVRFEFSSCLLGGLWFAKSEPNMHLFLSTFTRELHDLYDFGFFWKPPNHDKIKSKVILLNCVVDSKAKPAIQDCKSHNGYWGCGFCSHPGKMYDGSNQAKYPMNDDLVLLVDNSFTYTVDALHPVSKEPQTFNVEDCNNESMRRDMELAEINRNEIGEGDIRGVKGKSILMDLPYFDVVFGFPVEYLHAVLLGVTRHVTNLWFDSKSHGKLYYVGLRINEVNRRLLKIKPPISITRRPRKLCDRKKWKGNEWRAWLLFYSLPCMKGVLASRYVKHHCLLVSAIYILLQDEISSDEIEKAAYYLGTYCSEFAVHYTNPMMFFNVHLLMHLPKCVEMWGPLYCYSAFSFESGNGKLVNLVKGTKGVLNQIAEKYTKCRMLPKVIDLYEVSESTSQFCGDIMSYKPSKVAYKFDTVTVLGSEKIFPLEENMRQALIESGHNVTASSYERMVIGNVMFHARCYTRRGDKSDSSVVQLQNGEFGVIERILDPSHLRGPQEPSVLVLVRSLNEPQREPITSHPIGAKAEHIIECYPIVFGNLKVISAKEIKKLAILIECDYETYVTTFPNVIEKD